jgi:hypothetical protein
MAKILHLIVLLCLLVLVASANSASITIPAGKSVTIPAGKTMTVAGTAGNSLGPPLAPRASSPHWDHINTMGWFNGVWGYTGANYRAAVQFIASRIDLMLYGSPTFNADVMGALGKNPTMKLFGSQIDLTTCVDATLPPIGGVVYGSGCGMTRGDVNSTFFPESAYLHFAEDTSVTFIPGPNSLTRTYPRDAVGSCATTPMRKACRVETSGGPLFGLRWQLNVKDSGYQTKALGGFPGLARPANDLYGQFLDEHFNDFGNGPANVTVNSGGAILEYPGYNLANSASPNMRYGSLSCGVSGMGGYGAGQLSPYGVDVCNWLRLLVTTLTNQRFWPNGADSIFDTAPPQTKVDALAAHGYNFENGNRIGAYTFGGASMYFHDNHQDWVTFVNTLLSNGGQLQYEGSDIGAPGGELLSFVAGNYQSPIGRYFMWSLASYYILKEPVGSPGKIWYGPFHPIPSGNGPYGDMGWTVTKNCTTATYSQCQWMPAIQVDVGQPTAAAFKVAHSWGADSFGVPTCTAPFTCPAQLSLTPPANGCSTAEWYVVGRFYTKALVLLRPGDATGCTAHDDTTRVRINLDQPRVILFEDGTHSAPVTFVELRNAEAVILGFP